MTFSLTSLAALAIGLHKPSPLPLSLIGRGRRAASGEGWLALSGVLAGLAMLSKSPAIVLVPTAGLVLMLNALQQHAPFRLLIRSSLIWGLSAAFIFIALYPAMWIAPLKALQRLTETAEKHGETAHAVNFFFGKSERDPGAAFYPVVLAFRSTPVLWPGLIAFGALLARAKSQADLRLRRTAWPFWVLAILFVGVITLGAKKLDRYALPTLEALNVIGALGLAFMIDWIARRSATAPPRGSAQSTLPIIAVALIMIITAAQFLAVWPLTLRAYNPILGGYEGASCVLPVGGGESAEVGRLLATSPYALSTIAATDLVGTAPFFAGALVPTTNAGFTQADYALFTAADLQLTPDIARRWIGEAAPVLTATVQHQVFAWLYPNQWLQADRQRLIDQRRSGDAVIVDYAAALPSEATRLLQGDLTDAAALDLLKQLAVDHRRMFVFHYAVSPRRTSSALFRLLDTYAINLDQWSSPLSDGALYALPDQLTFSAQSTPLHSGAIFDNRLQLTHAELIQASVQPGQSIGVIGEWQATGADAKFTVSLIDAAGHEWSAGDGAIPLLQEDQVSRPRRIGVPVPLTIPPGAYRLVMNAASGGTTPTSASSGRSARSRSISPKRRSMRRPARRRLPSTPISMAHSARSDRTNRPIPSSAAIRGRSRWNGRR